MNALAARYLYGLTEPLDGDIVEAYLTVLVMIAQVNNVVDDEDKLLRGISEALGAPPFLLTRLMMASRDQEEVEEAFDILREQPELLHLAYRDAILIARVDGLVDEGEAAFLEEMAGRLGLTHVDRSAASEMCDTLEGLYKRVASLKVG